jgi:hypothetical protein
MRINLSGGPFAPGRTDEGDGSSEIEFSVDTGSGGDTVIVTATEGPDAFLARHLGANLNAGEPVEDLDVAWPNYPLRGRGGDDYLSADGSAATVRETWRRG